MSFWQYPPLHPKTLVAGLDRLTDRDATAMETLSPHVFRNRGGQYVLIWSDVAQRKAPAGVTALGKLYAKGVEPLSAGRDHTLSDYDRLGIALLRYLTDRDDSDAPDRRPESGHAMVLAGGLTASDLARILNAVNTHSTTLRAALASVQGREIAVLHARDDRSRGSTLESLLRLNEEAWPKRDARILFPYRTRHGTLFLPHDNPPPQGDDDSIANLFRRAPGLFDISRPADTRLIGIAPDNVLAFDPRGFDGERQLLVDLTACVFLGASAFQREASRPEIVAVRPLDPQDGLVRMEERLREGERLFGESLRLRPAEESKHELDGIQRRIAQLSRRRALLMAGRRPKTRLLRCDEAGFDALANVMRSIHAAGGPDLVRTSYACEEREDGLRHYLLVDRPVGATTGTDGTKDGRRWETMLSAVGGAMLFWSDPVWSRDYAGKALCRIHTPLGTSLMPFPHSWNVGDFDAFVMDKIAEWSGDGVDVPFEDGAHLVFERGQEGRLRLTVLPASVFAPLERPVVAWINDLQGLHVATSAARETGTAAPRESHVDAALAAQGEAMAGSGTAALDAARALVETQADRIVEEFSRHLRDLAEAGEALRADIAQRESTLAAIASRYATLDGVCEEIRALDTLLAGRAAAATESIHEGTSAGVTALEDMRRRFDAQSAALNARIEKLETDRTALVAKITGRS